MSSMATIDRKFMAMVITFRLLREVALLDKFLHGRSWTHHRNMSFLCLARNKAGIIYMDIPQVLRLNIADVVFHV